MVSTLYFLKNSFVIWKWLLAESVIFRPLVKGNKDSGDEIGGATISDMRHRCRLLIEPDGQNSVISYVISKWWLPELSFSDRWLRGTKTLGTRLYSWWRIYQLRTAWRQRGRKPYVPSTQIELHISPWNPSYLVNTTKKKRKCVNACWGNPLAGVTRLLGKPACWGSRLLRVTRSLG